MIRKDISRSKKLRELSPEALSLFCLLIPHFNAHGKMEAHPAAIKGIVCPWIDWLGIPQIERCLHEISENTNVKWFQSDGGHYLHALRWDDHQEIRRRGRDYLPSYPGDLPPSAGSRAAQFSPESELERKREPEEQRVIVPTSARPSHGRITESRDAYTQRIETFFNHIPESDNSAWVKAYPGIDIESEIQKARLWLLSNPNNRKKNLDRFITNWLARSQERGIRRTGINRSGCTYAPGTPEHTKYLEAEKRWKERE